MIDSEDSLVAPTKSSPLKAVVAVAVIAAVGGVGLWLMSRGKGQPEDPARVLIVGPTPELAGFLEDEGFDVTHTSPGEAIGEGQTHDPSLDGVAAMIEYADQLGIGYLALNLAHGERYDFAAAGYEAQAAPPGTTFAVLSVGDLGKTLTYGGVVPQVVHEKPAGEQVGLMLALFGQQELAKARTRDAANDLMIRFGSAGTIEDLLEYEKGQENMHRQIDAWQALAERERGEPKPIELAGPYENLRGWPLANGAVLLASGRGAWRSSDGRETSWQGDDLEAELRVAEPDALSGESGPEQYVPCSALPDTLSLQGEGGFAVAPAGDALLIPSDRWVADLWVLSGPGCGFEKRDQIRRLDNLELGLPRASGRTAASLDGRLMWADAKMRRYRQLQVEGIDLHHGELHWADDETVVIPATLDFGLAANARARRMALAAAGDGPLPELEPIDPTTLPSPREALIFAKLPPPRQNEDMQVAVIPVDALLPASEIDDPSKLSIRDVFPLAKPAGPGELIALVDAPDGSRLVRLTLTADAKPWRDVLAADYDLAAASEAGEGAVEVEVLAADLPHEAHDLAISPTGSHAAWAAPFGDAPSDAALGNFEIVLLPLGVEGATPTRLTDNDRSDLRPRFVGERGSMLIFDTSYAAADDLPAVEALRALAVP
jgi:hypothetical protein